MLVGKSSVGIEVTDITAGKILADHFFGLADFLQWVVCLFLYKTDPWYGIGKKGWMNHGNFFQEFFFCKFFKKTLQFFLSSRIPPCKNPVLCYISSYLGRKCNGSDLLPFQFFKGTLDSIKPFLYGIFSVTVSGFCHSSFFVYAENFYCGGTQVNARDHGRNSILTKPPGRIRAVEIPFSNSSREMVSETKSSISTTPDAIRSTAIWCMFQLFPAPITWRLLM